jgi:hypothetical protein
MANTSQIKTMAEAKAAISACKDIASAKQIFDALARRILKDNDEFTLLQESLPQWNEKCIRDYYRREYPKIYNLTVSFMETVSWLSNKSIVAGTIKTAEEKPAEKTAEKAEQKQPADKPKTKKDNIPVDWNAGISFTALCFGLLNRGKKYRMLVDLGEEFFAGKGDTRRYEYNGEKIKEIRIVGIDEEGGEPSLECKDNGSIYFTIIDKLRRNNNNCVYVDADDNIKCIFSSHGRALPVRIEEI